MHSNCNRKGFKSFKQGSQSHDLIYFSKNHVGCCEENKLREQNGSRKVEGRGGIRNGSQFYLNNWVNLVGSAGIGETWCVAGEVEGRVLGAGI